MKKFLIFAYRALDFLFPVTIIIHWSLICNPTTAEYVRAYGYDMSFPFFFIFIVMAFAAAYTIGKVQRCIGRTLKKSFNYSRPSSCLFYIAMLFPLFFLLTVIVICFVLNFVLSSMPKLIFPAFILLAFCYALSAFCIGGYLVCTFALKYFKRGERAAGKAYDLETGEVIEVTVADPADHRNPFITYEKQTQDDFKTN